MINRGLRKAQEESSKDEKGRANLLYASPQHVKTYDVVPTPRIGQ